ncbi:molybdate ABC transporter substrate-binding protein [Listeria sp. PSOL-1]|uniref:molybdate ABC transporter substrate-binding protein n=1 Tax=Listeria sp. PSOL-1 TaxID=1844999 RepID=UPI0013D4D1CC|nr:molybdate ABC transporter substrate-binding protein [Listeria sp. PSOL-1]
MKKLALSGLLVLIVLLSACSGAKEADKKANKPTEIHISVAASLKEAVDDIKPQFEKEHPNIKVTFDFGGSGQIRERVESGAPIDGVLFASAQDMDKLTKKNKAEDKQQFAKNTLVLIEPKDAEQKKEQDLKASLESYNKLAIGDPNSVPAGKYAQETLQNLKIEDQVKSKLVLGSDVRQVLAYVASGNAPAGFVYQTDALISKKVKVTAKIPENLHSPIGYYSGVVTDSKNKKAVQTFMKTLVDKEAQNTLKKYGFQAVK